jgi:hypothetical protein
MAMGEVSASSFEFYDGIRIFVPGSFVVGTYAAIAGTFGFPGGRVVDDAIVGLLSALAVGFVLMLLDFPGRAAVTSYESPTSILASWDESPRSGRTRLNIYYLLLDSEFPPGLRTRTHYLGVIYRIGFEALYIFALSSLAVLTLASVFPKVGADRPRGPSIEKLSLAALGVHLILIAIAMIQRYVEWGPKVSLGIEHRFLKRWKGVFGDLAKEIPMRDRSLLLIGLVLTTVFLMTERKWAGVFGIALPAFLWAMRYFRGVPLKSGDTPRFQNLHAVSAALLFGFTAASACLITAYGGDEQSPLNSRIALGWLAMSLLASVLIVFRGHERKLIGSHGTQRAWLQLNRQKVVEKYLAPLRSQEPAED